MDITGIVCEYNPLHLGHKKQIDLIKASGSSVVCLMSGDFVQRGAPAIVDKMRRAEAAVRCGADLVLELPVIASLSSAEAFAAESVRILSPFCDHLCFGAEHADLQNLMTIAQVLLSADFSEALRTQLDTGLSFPAARQKALQQLGICSNLLSMPNNILAVEYCKAILSQNSKLTPLPILREGNYHDTAADTQNPSATAVRQRMENGEDWVQFIPQSAVHCFTDAPLHSAENGERAILARLRCMTEAEFEALPHSSEGLWRRFMHAVKKSATLEQIRTAVKSKRYTRTRLDRMLMCAYLGISREILTASAPYVRALAFNNTGREILKKARKFGDFPNIGENREGPYPCLEIRCTDLYSLCSDTPQPPGAAQKSRVFYLKST